MSDGQVLEFSGVTKKFGAVTAVSDFSATVQPGRVTGFLGPNGAGKTTSLRILLGLAQPTSGYATIGGTAYRDLKNPSQVVGAALEANSFHPGRTARAHLKVYATAGKIDRSRIDEVLERVGLAEAADRKVGGFSLGMRQRLSLATALLGDPGIIVLDEPSNGLDPEGIRWIRGFLRDLAREGRTVLVSSHMLGEIQQIADDLIVISGGKKVFAGSLHELIALDASDTVVVDSPDRAALAAALRNAGLEAQVLRSGLTVHGATPAEIGAAAAAAGVALSSLGKRGPSVEDIFLDLVSGTRTQTPAAAVVAEPAAAVAEPAPAAAEPAAAEPVGAEVAEPAVADAAGFAEPVVPGLAAAEGIAEPAVAEIAEPAVVDAPEDVVPETSDAHAADSLAFNAPIDDIVEPAEAEVPVEESVVPVVAEVEPVEAESVLANAPEDSDEYVGDETVALDVIAPAAAEPQAAEPTAEDHVELAPGDEASAELEAPAETGVEAESFAEPELSFDDLLAGDGVEEDTLSHPAHADADAEPEQPTSPWATGGSPWTPKTTPIPVAEAVPAEQADEHEVPEPHDSPATTEAPTADEAFEALVADAPEAEAPQADAPEASEFEAPVTEVPEFEAPVTEIPEFEAPAAEAPDSEASETEAPEAPEEPAPTTRNIFPPAPFAAATAPVTIVPVPEPAAEPADTEPAETEDADLEDLDVSEHTEEPPTHTGAWERREERTESDEAADEFFRSVGLLFSGANTSEIPVIPADSDDTDDEKEGGSAQ